MSDQIEVPSTPLSVLIEEVLERQKRIEEKLDALLEVPIIKKGAINLDDIALEPGQIMKVEPQLRDDWKVPTDAKTA